MNPLQTDGAAGNTPHWMSTTPEGVLHIGCKLATGTVQRVKYRAFAALLLGATACTSGPSQLTPSHCLTAVHGKVVGSTPLDRWLGNARLYVAHRGGDRDWAEGSADAYRQAAAWNSALALEVPVWRSVDGVWVVSEDPTTGRVFNRNLDIRLSTWEQLSTLSSKVGSTRMARLVNDVLRPYGSSRILFIDNKADTDASAFFDLLDSYAGRTRYVSKGYFGSVATPAEASRRGYLTWGYYYAKDMKHFAATQARFDLLGLAASAPRSAFETMFATGKPVIAHIVATPSVAATAFCDGAAGIMVSGVKEVVPRT